MRPISEATRAIAWSYGIGLNPLADDESRRKAVVSRSGCEPWRYRFTPFGTEHAAVERELLPRLEADDLIVADLELNTALLAAEAAMRLHQPLRLDTGREPHPRHRRQVRPETLDDPQRISRYFRHARLPYLSFVTVVQVLPPQPALRQSEQRPPTLGTDLLIVATIRQLVSKSELALDDGEIADHRH